MDVQYNLGCMSWYLKTANLLYCKLFAPYILCMTTIGANSHIVTQCNMCLHGIKNVQYYDICA